MSKKAFLCSLLCGFFFMNSAGAFAESSPPPSKRPPQFVEFAFDGSLSIPMWNETRLFASTLETQNNPFHFTYFISAVYFLTHANAGLYTAPYKGPAQSAIGFGRDSNDLFSRIDQINKALEEKHEIASHLNAHFPGASKWLTSDWEHEFNVFNFLTNNVYQTNKLVPAAGQPTKLDILGEQMIGFRAPFLEVSSGLYETEKNHHFRYDTSRTSATNYWPKKNLGTDVWNFPLGEVKIAGTGKRTLSMDYNFYYAQSGAKEDLKNASLYEKQMFDTYLQYFASNYNGNRAPVHIGHHFLMMNGGAYWRAMKSFAEAVCHQPEVLCVNYRELTEFMDSLDPVTLANYQVGNFEKSKPFVPLQEIQKPLDLTLKLTQKNSEVKMNLGGQDLGSPGGEDMIMHWELDGKKLDSHSEAVSGAVQGTGGSLKIDQLARFVKKGQKSKLSAVGVKNGVEVLRATHEVSPKKDSVGLVIGDENLEDKALKGDFNEAHEIYPEDK